MDYTKILKKTFDEMPDVFTSYTFTRNAIKNGFPESKLKYKGLASFIRKHAVNEYRHSKTWYKDKAEYKTENEQKNTSESKKYEFKFNDVGEIISFLKSKGYKVLKQKWVEE